MIIVFVEGRFDRAARAATAAEATAFCQGYCAAAERFRANTALYVLPGDVDEMRDFEHRDEVRRALDEVVGL